MNPLYPELDTHLSLKHPSNRFDSKLWLFAVFNKPHWINPIIPVK